MLNRSPRQISGRKPVLIGPAHWETGANKSAVSLPGGSLQRRPSGLRHFNQNFCRTAPCCSGLKTVLSAPVRHIAVITPHGSEGRASVQTLARPGFNRITYSKNPHTASESPPSAPGLLCRRAQGFRLHIRSGSRFPRPNAWPPAHSR